ncbi:transcription factor IIA alpha/beta subunit [Ephemerocybe angulata]|uniref:Transcription factor IIA alpha/beta subunit n=1 Tax=Ephemerocybe angulata TaxID=980116 RepID=A0A8H6IF27_9AGAR|nr:transcription factor IIA alpha/beta subunit [Tulosesus angulatus]
MSNKIVPGIYRSVIDEVIAAIKPEFDEYGVPEDVLAELQHKWESKVIASHVAEFETPQAAPAAPPAPHVQPLHQSYPPHPMHMMQTHPHYANPYAHMAATVTATGAAPQGQPTVKTEPIENRYMLAPYTTTSFTGSQRCSASTSSSPTSRSRNSRLPGYRKSMDLRSPLMTMIARLPHLQGRLLQGTMHPSLPQPVAAVQRAQTPADSEAINSDLDDSDTENEEEADEGGVGDSDIVFCTYDKVARVKNKWKCVLKDGMIHVNGKDYLFAKCTGEFEW